MKSISIKTVISKLIRDMRIKDADYLPDVVEWIAEAHCMLQVSDTLEKKHCVLNVRDHCIRIPSDCEVIIGVEDKNGRLPYGSEQRMPSFLSRYDKGFKEDVTDSILDYTGTTHWNGDNLVAYTDSYSTEFYTINYNTLMYSRPEGELHLHYLGLPVDCDGLPLIPDNANYAEALYYFGRMKLIGAGYPDKVLDYESCRRYHELYARRAVGEITYPSIDKLERLKRSMIRLLPREEAWMDFFNGREQGESLKLGQQNHYNR